ncbi:hypothetical protein FBUS_05027, partial [Fasciolopsis buskii]
QIRFYLLLTALLVAIAHGVVLPASCNPFCDRNYVECIVACDYQTEMHPWECRTICAQDRQQCVVENCSAVHSLERKSVSLT